MVDLKNVSACLISKESRYPKVILDHISQFPFGEILILCNSDSPYRKHELFAKAKHDWLYYQDDDAICPIAELAEQAEPGIITLAMKQHHFDSYKNKRLAMGLGWGAFFEKKLLNSLNKYRAKYGEDYLFRRETERVLTYLNYPQKRLVLPIYDLPSAFAPDRLSMEPGHYDMIPKVEEKCFPLLSPHEQQLKVG